MFHLLGNLIFGSRSNESGSQTVEQLNGENNTTNANNNLITNEASTQTSINLVNNTQKNGTESASVSNNESNTQQAANRNNNSKSTGELDWVIVDRSEEADKLNRSIGTSTSANNMDVGVNTSMIVDNNNQMAYATKQTSAQDGAEQTEKVIEKEEDSDEVLLGSFFERNEHTDGEEEMQHDDEEDEVKQKDWLITPLPCLTSITTSQRSIVENHPFENLLIEHPSMSVFVSATSSNNQMKDDVIEEDDVTPADVAAKNDEQSLAKASKSVKRPSPAVVSTIKKSQSEKRKESQQIASETSPIQSIRKKGRKHRKSTSSTSSSSGNGSTSDLTSANKENMQVKSLLVQPCNKFGLSNQINKQFDCSHISKKNQLNRFNKIATFSSVKNVNNKQQRKFHKLQQPASYSFNQAQCF